MRLPHKAPHDCLRGMSQVTLGVIESSWSHKSPWSHTSPCGPSALSHPPSWLSPASTRRSAPRFSRASRAWTIHAWSWSEPVLAGLRPCLGQHLLPPRYRDGRSAEPSLGARLCHLAWRAAGACGRPRASLKPWCLPPHTREAAHQPSRAHFFRSSQSLCKAARVPQSPPQRKAPPGADG